MDKVLASIRSQKYSVVKSEDVDESTSEASQASKGSNLATSVPSQHALYPRLRFFVSRELLVVHLVWLLILISSIFCLQAFSPKAVHSRLPSDEVFGEIPYRIVSWENDLSFVNADPMQGRRWNQSLDAWTPWDDIHPGSWVRMTPSSKLGISGGIPLREYSEDKSWDTDDQGFALSMHHQIHCLGLIKHALFRYERNQTIAPGFFRHTDHCVEYIRQAILCHGDLTLEPLQFDSTRYAIESDTWGSMHYCRDWGALKNVVWKHSTVGFDKHGNVFDNKDFV